MVDHFFETSCEKDLVINNRELKYKGIFRSDEIFSAINRALEEKGYEKREKKTEELVTEMGKKTYIELRPFKVKANYLALMLKIRINLDNVVEVVEKIGGAKEKFQQGNVNIFFDAWTLTDYEQRWQMKPWVFFLKGFINKFVYIFPLEGGMRGEVVGDTAFIYAQVKKLLNSYHPEIKKQVREEDIRKQIEAEISKEMEE